MSPTIVVRGTALAACLGLLALSGSPALAADPVARASATGASVSVGGQSQSSGTYAVTNDGTTERVTGQKNAALPALTGQNAISFGTVAQDARTTVTNGNGASVACAGAAGNGATVVSVGSSPTCLSGGGVVDLNAGTLDLSNVKLVGNPALDPVNAALQQVLTPVGTALNTATTQLFAALGNPAIQLSLGALQSSCQADTTSASGTANLANAGAFVTLPAVPGQAQQTIQLVSFPANPAPNTKVVTGADKVADLIVASLQTSLAATADSALADPVLGATLAPLLTQVGVGLGAVRDQLIQGVLAQITPQLAPLEANLIDGTLNKQTSTSANQITVTALDLNVLPVAGNNSLQLQVGTSSCGPNGRVVAAAATAAPTPTPTPKSEPQKPKNPVVPTSVPAGLASAPADPMSPWALAGLGGLLAASVAAGAASYRRRLRG